MVTPDSPVQVPIAAPASSSQNDARTSARLEGTSSAAPTPCSARAAISAFALGAKPHNIDATANAPSPTMKTRRRPKRSPRPPPTRSSDPRNSR